MRRLTRVRTPLAAGLFLACASFASTAAASELTFDSEAPPAVEESSDIETAADEGASEVVERFARWVVSRDDHRDRPFAIVDKVRARVFVYDAEGRLDGSAPVLMGSALSDETSPEVGELELAQIPAEQRTTGAGRFDARLGPAKGETPEVLWLDYDSGLSLHPVITGNRKQRRLQRLATPTPLDNRITFGCINVPADFYEGVVRSAFEGQGGVVYILPETRDVEAVFPEFRWNRRDRRSVAVMAGSDAEPAVARTTTAEAQKLSTLLGF
jgi:hypothetical protein